MSPSAAKERVPGMDLFLRDVAHRLDALSSAERTEILLELAAHFESARAQGMSDEDVVRRLGSARAVAQGYLRELAMAPTTTRRRLDVLFRVIGLLSTLGLPTIVICTVLATVGATLLVTGIGGFLAAAVAPWLPNGTLPPDFKTREALLYGLPLAVGGLAALGALVLYVRVVLRLAKQTATGLPLSMDHTILPPWLQPIFRRLRR